MKIKIPVISTMLMFSAQVSAQEDCEVHIFPTTNVEILNKLGSYGALSEALAGASPSKDTILNQLSSDIQIDAVRSTLGKDQRFVGYQFIAQEKTIDYKTAVKNKTRLTSSNAICYLEIAMVSIVFSDSALTSKKIGIMAVVREFDQGSDNPKIKKLGGASKLESFPQEDKATADAQSFDYADGFQNAFKQSVLKFWKSKP